MATTVHSDQASILNLGTGIAFDIEISECISSNSPVPKWVRQRLEDHNLECKAKSLEDIEARLKEADLRRQVKCGSLFCMCENNTDGSLRWTAFTAKEQTERSLQIPH